MNPRHERTLTIMRVLTAAYAVVIVLGVVGIVWQVTR